MAKRRNEQRDYDIYVRRMNGETIASLAKEFGLSKQRIVQIVDKIKYDHDIAKKYTEVRANNFMKLKSIDILMARYSAFAERHIIIRAYNALRYAKPCDDYEKWNFERFLEKANDMDYDQLLNCRNIGVKTADFIMMVKNDFASSSFLSQAINDPATAYPDIRAINNSLSERIGGV